MTVETVVEHLCLLWGSPGDSDGKESSCNAGDLGVTPGSGRSPGEANGNSLQYSCLENSVNRGAWVGYSPWGPKESNMTGATNTHFHSFCSLLTTCLDSLH